MIVLSLLVIKILCLSRESCSLKSCSPVKILIAMAEIIQIAPLLGLSTPLEEIPREWILYFEPKIVRQSYLPCWMWKAKCLKDNGGFESYPIAYIKGKEYSARKEIAKLFWQFPDSYVILMTCQERLCVNPNHMLITTRNDVITSKLL